MNMETSLSSEQIIFYRENGFLVIDPLLSVDELTVWRITLDEAINERIIKQHTTKTEARTTTSMYLSNVLICGKLTRKFVS